MESPEAQFFIYSLLNGSELKEQYTNWMPLARAFGQFSSYQTSMTHSLPQRSWKNLPIPSRTLVV
jgi:hypothetical protein